MICLIKELRDEILILDPVEGTQFIEIRASQHEIEKLLDDFQGGDTVAFAEGESCGKLTLAICNENLVVYLFDGSTKYDPVAITAKNQMEEYLRGEI